MEPPGPTPQRTPVTTWRTIRSSVAALLAVVLIGTAGYVVLEGWPWLDALWMVVITLTTIGFGEVHPLTPAGRLFSLGLILGGVAVATVTFSRLTSVLLDGEMIRVFRQRRKERRMKALHDHFIVVGYGRLGRVIVGDLLRSGAEVCVVERDAAIASNLETQDRVPVVHGDGASDAVLRTAGIERARGLAIALPSSAEAVYVSMSAQQLHPGLEIVTRVDESEATDRARRVGARQVVSPYQIAGWRMAHGLLKPSMARFLDLATFSMESPFSVDEVEVPKGSPYAGRTLSEMRLGSEHKILVVAIQRADASLVPTPGAMEKLASGDTIIAIGTPDHLVRFHAMLAGGR
ncbi:MAG: potassium channel protein [Deltaproteobacteria bacterium]|nr:potassium channel protein [Deltaproteobacteria bacterium]